MENLKDLTLQKLQERNVQIKELAPIVYQLQVSYTKNLTLEECEQCINSVLEKREVQHAVLTGILIDEWIEQNQNKNAIYQIIKEDNSLYGIDEIIALSIINLYGSIALTTFGYLDKTKPDIIGKIDKLGHNPNTCNTFLDDILCAITAAAASKIAHTKSNL